MDRTRPPVDNPAVTRDAEEIREIIRESEARVHEFFRVIGEPSVESQPDESRHGRARMVGAGWR